MPISDSSSLAVALRDEIHELLSPLIGAAQQAEGVQILFESLGRTADVGNRADLREEIKRIAKLVGDLSALETESLDSWTGLAKVLSLSQDLITAIRDLERLASDPSLGEQGRDLGRDLVEHLLALHLRTHHSSLFRVGSLLTLITPAELSAPLPLLLDGSKVVGFPRCPDQFHPERINDLVKDPLSVLAAHYFPNKLASAEDAHEAARRLFPVLALLADTLGLKSFSGAIRATPETESPAPTEGGDGDHFNGTTTTERAGELSPLEPFDITTYLETFLPRFVFLLPGQVSETVQTPLRLGLSALVSSAKHPGGATGLVIGLIGELGWSEERSGWRISCENDGQVPAFVIGPGGVSLPPNAALASATARFLIERLAQEGAPAFVFGAAKGTRLEIGALKFATELRLAQDESDIVLAADAKSGTLVLDAGDGDSFISALLPKDGLKCGFNLGVELSSHGGLRLRGSAGLDATLPIGLSIGGVTVPAVHVGLLARDSRLHVEVSASVGVSIGPIRALLDRVGLTAEVTFPERGGNLAIADLALDFKAPSGVGLAIEATGVSGAGFLSLDSARGQYAGFVQLTIREFLTVTAIGIITTKLPNGERGFSLVVMITAEGFKPIPLGLGFTLTAIGGLLAINRTCAEDFLLEGIKNQTLDTLLFPKDPLRDAVQIFGTLNNAFPPRLGCYLFGPVVRICWGTPPLLTMDLALVLEIGKRRRLIILGKVSAIMPSEKRDLLRLQMNALGIIDFDQNTISLNATLFDSRLAGKFPITGQMAMRLSWGSAPMFALSIGGFHPAFKPPASFPTLERLAISFSNSSDFRLRAECYVAITSNTLQFGAKLELYARAAGFSIEGRLGFDVLIQFDPFMFLADFYASVQLKRGSYNLFKVKVEGELSGPRPLHVKGKATFEIFWCDFSVRFDRTLVEGERPPQLAPVNVTELLVASLNDSRNWGGQIPEGTRRLVTLREPQAGERIVFHPLGTLGVKQNVVPLDLEISRFGNAIPADARLFKISSFSVAEAEVNFKSVQDSFAPSQFFDMSDEEKLSAPSFELLNAGVTAGVAGVVFTANDEDILETAIEYETIIVDGQPKTETPPAEITRVNITPDFFARHLSLSAAARSVRKAGALKYRPAAAKYSLGARGWTIVSTEDGSEQGTPGFAAGTVGSYAEAFQELQKLRATNPAKTKTLMLVRTVVKKDG